MTAEFPVIRKGSSTPSSCTSSIIVSLGADEMHLPITALATVLVNKQSIIIVGQGPYLRLHHSQTNQLLSSRRVFDVQPIHHIAHQSGSGPPRIVVAGGRYVAVIAIITPGSDGFDLRATSLLSISAKEWILRVHPHEDAYLFLTTNNNLLRLDPRDSSEEPEPIKELAQGPGASLYSGDICSVTAGKILVAAGSVFGEVLVWTCAQLDDDSGARWIVRVTHRFEGHTGSIFGVRISEPLIWGDRPARLVASCSDDRTVQVWDVTDDNDVSSSSDRLEEATNTGFGQDAQDSRHRVALGWGHQSRIWDVEFLAEPNDTDLKQLRLATRGEDGTCQFWVVSLSSRDAAAQQSTKLLPTSSGRYHSGKNVWAWTRFRRGDIHVIVSGGADGRVVTRNIPYAEFGVQPAAVYSKPFKQLPVDPSSQSLKDYAVVDDNDGNQQILAVTGSGTVVRCTPSADDDYLWDAIVNIVDFSVLKLCNNAPSGVLIAATTKGILVRRAGCKQLMVEVESLIGKAVAWVQVAGVMKHATTAELQLCLIVTSITGNTCLIWLNQASDSLPATRHTLELPDHFILTSSTYDYAADMLVLGSRAGAVAIYFSLRKMSPACLPPHCVRHVHGSDAVTSLQYLRPSEGEGVKGEYVLSTGRDGRYGLHRIIAAATEDLPTFQTVHSACPPFGPYVEGASVIATNESARKDLILHGFRSKDFVVWNETQQLDVFSVDCGGAHRSWAYRNHATMGHEGGTLAWTKAGTFNLYPRSSPVHKIVQPGGHGREIKALSACPRSFSSWEHGLVNAPLFATGAEDTTIRIFGVKVDSGASDSEPRLVQLCAMNDHTAGLQDLAFSSCGGFLFSSGGAEQLYAWRISFDIPLIGVGSVLQDKMPQTDDDSDVRIMGLSICRAKTASVQTFSLAAAYSNGKVKLLQYSPAETLGKGTWVLEREVLFGSFCLMQVFHLSAPAHPGMTTSLLTAGTNGFVNLTGLQASESAERPMMVHGVHQSSVLAMDVVELGFGSQFIATGGDDHALGFTVLVGATEAAMIDGEAKFATVRIRDAHAAALTALKIFSSSKGASHRRLRVATAGNDQTVKVWEVDIPTDTPKSSASFQAIKLCECWTAVADVSCIDIVGTRLIVSGVGIELLDLDLEFERMAVKAGTLSSS